MNHFHKALLNIIKNEPGILRRDIHRKFRNHMSSMILSELLDKLIRSIMLGKILLADQGISIKNF